MKTYMGIDPGKTGAVAVINRDCAEVHGWPGDVMLAAEMVCDLRLRHDIALCFIEKVSARPGQGVSSMFSFGTNYGQWQGLLAAYCIPYEFVIPRKWQTVLDSGGGDTKTRSLSWARRRFPELDLSRKRDDGKADALGLAVYASQQHTGGTK